VAKPLSGKFNAQSLTAFGERLKAGPQARARQPVTSAGEVRERHQLASALQQVREELSFELAAETHALEEARQALELAQTSGGPDHQERVDAAQAQLRAFEAEVMADRNVDSLLGAAVGQLTYSANRYQNQQISRLRNALEARTLERPAGYKQFVDRVEANLRAQLKHPDRQVDLRLAVALSSEVFRDSLSWEVQLEARTVQELRGQLSWLAAAHKDLGRAPTEAALRKHLRKDAPARGAPWTLGSAGKASRAMFVWNNVARAVSALRNPDQAASLAELVTEAKARGLSPRQVYEHTGVVTEGFDVRAEQRAVAAELEKTVDALVAQLRVSPLKPVVPADLSRATEASLKASLDDYRGA